MIALLTVALLTAAQNVPPPSRQAYPELSPYICAASRETPLGTVGVQKDVSLTGVVGVPIFSWETGVAEDQVRDDRRLFLMASWGHIPGTDSSAPRFYSDIQIAFHVRGPRPRTFRLRLQDMSGLHETIMGLDSGPIPARDGWTTFHTEWGAVTGLLDEADGSRFIVLGDDREFFRSQPIRSATFRNAREMAERLEPELAPLLADYRHRCLNTARIPSTAP